MYSLHKQQRQLTKKILLGLSIGMFSILPVLPAQATPAATELPNAGAYAAFNNKTADFTTANNTLTITGKNTNNILKWQDFNIGEKATVAFDNNNYLNLVNGSTKSEIYGTLTGGGNIYLINPNGVLFGSTASVSVGGILGVSTRPIDEVDKTAFSNGNSPLSGTSSNLSADIINQGKIQATSVKLEGDDIVLTRTDNITSDGTTLLKDVTLTAGDGTIDVGYAYDSTTQKATSTKGSDVGYTHNKDITDYQLITDLSSIKTNAKYMLANDITLVGTTTPVSQQTLTLNGAGFNIKGINSNQGLFSSIKESTIKHLTLNYKINAATGTVGGLAGQATSSTIDDVNVSGTLTDTDATGNSYVGGIIGKMVGGTLTNSSSSATVTVESGSKVGGLVGIAQPTGSDVPTISKSSNSGSVTASKMAGGIVGQTSGAVNLTKVKNSGTIKAITKQAGGIAGEAHDKANINIALNTGNVTSASQAGGIAGDDKATTVIKNAYNSGTITASSKADGIVGGANGSATVEYTYSTDNPTSDLTGFEADIWDTSSGSPRLIAFLHKQDLTDATNLTTLTYNAANQASSLTGASYGFGDTVSASTDTELKNAGTYEGVVTLTDTAADGYLFTGKANATIDKTKLKVNVSDGTMTYGSSAITYTDGSTTGYTVDSSSLLGSDTLDSIQDDTHKLSIKVSNAALATDEDKATNAGKVTKDAGTYVGGLTAADNGSTLQNYYVSTGNAGTVTVNKAKLKATIQDISTTYGTAFNNNDCLVIDQDSFVNGDSNDTLTGITYTNTGAADGTNGRVTQDAGEYSITADVSTSKNYDIEWEGSGTNTAKATVNKAKLNLDTLAIKDSATGEDVTTTYGTAFNSANYTVASTDSNATGFVNGDTPTSLGVTVTNAGAADGTNGRVTQNVGSYDISATLDASTLTNYELTSSTGSNTVTGTATVTPATLTLTADTVTGVPAGWATTTGYSTTTTNGTNDLTLYSGSVSGYVNGDTASILDGASVVFTSTAPETAGSYALTGSINGSTASYGNYYLQQADSNATALTIVANSATAPLTRAEVPVYSNIITAVSTTSNGSATSTPGEAAPQALTILRTSDTVSSAPTAENKSTGMKNADKDTKATQGQTSSNTKNFGGSTPVLTVLD